MAEGVRREDADDVVNRVCVHRVQDLFYETKLLCRRIYHGRRGHRVTRAQAVHLPLTKEQYLTVNMRLHHLRLIALKLIYDLSCARVRAGASCLVCGDGQLLGGHCGQVVE